MVNTALFRAHVKNSGLKYGFIAKSVNLTTTGLQKKIDGVNDFRAREIKGLSDVLKLSSAQRDEIFFGINSDKTSLIKPHQLTNTRR
jgi:hypothetical protein